MLLDRIRKQAETLSLACGCQDNAEKHLNVQGAELRALYERLISGGISLDEYTAENTKLNEAHSRLSNTKIEANTKLRDAINDALRKEAITGPLVKMLIDHAKVYPDKRVVFIGKTPEYETILEDADYA